VLPVVHIAAVEEARLDVSRLLPNCPRAVPAYIVTSWMEEGICKRLGPLEATFLERINSLSVEATEDPGEALLDFHEISDLSAWLDGQVGRATA